MPAEASGGGYSGPLAYRQGKPTPRLLSAAVEPSWRGFDSSRQVEDWSPHDS
jgi:hypothetical protein